MARSEERVVEVVVVEEREGRSGATSLRGGREMGGGDIYAAETESWQPEWRVVG